jgi:DNA processing protein
MNATEACIALNMLPTVGPVRLRKLLEVFREPQQILGAKRSDLRNVEGVGSEVADQISNWESTIDLSVELQRIRDFGATVMTQQSPSYPRALREIHAPPIVLYVWGTSVIEIITPSALSVRNALRITARNQPKNSLTNSLTLGSQ